VRELENTIEYAVVFCKNDTISPEDLPFARRTSGRPGEERSRLSDPLPAGIVDLPYRDAKQRALLAFEAAYFKVLLDRTGGNISEAARQAGLDRSNFRRAARRAGLIGRE
jgi:DNA-binding NtrC family response regulator